MRLLALFAAVLFVPAAEAQDAAANPGQATASATQPAQASETTEPTVTPAAFAHMSAADRRAMNKRLSREQVAELFKGISADQLLASGRKSIEALGTYSAKLVKRERVDGTLTDAQTLEVTVRGAPFAVRMDYVGGPSKGRRVLYSSSLRAREMRVREPGVKGVFGALWIDIDSGLTREDSNHAVTDMGLAAVIRLLEKDFDAAAKFGGFKRTDEGFNKRGLYCLRFDAPPGAKGLTATFSKVCMDAEHFAPLFVEVHDAKGLYERYEWSDVKARSVAKDFFTLEGADL